jgi:hypothetical protein
VTAPGYRECTKRRRDGAKCTKRAIAGTDACENHAGVPAAQHKARGQVALELSRWGLTDETLDPGVVMLRLMSQSYRRAELYSGLLEQAYDAAERLRQAEANVQLGIGTDDVDAADSASDRDRARQDLARVFATGGVSALIGHTWASAGEDGVYATGEAIRGLVKLEAEERDRAAGMAAKAAAAGIAERQVKLAEEQGRLVAQVIQGVLGDLGLDPADAGVMRVVATRLRALDGGQVA